MKILHWEYNEQLIGQEDSASPEMRIGLTKNSENDRPTGVYFVWTYLLKKGDEVCLHCLCQDDYSIIDLSLFELKLILYNSLENFKRVFRDRLDLIGLDVTPPVYKIHDEMLTRVLIELNQK